jgi:tetratricopeptide (TPR) repeat protein
MGAGNLATENENFEQGNNKNQSFENSLKLSIEAPETQDQVRTYLNRGSTYFKQGRYRAARADFDRVVKLAPDNWKGFFCRGLAHLKANKINKGTHKVANNQESGSAVDDFTKVIELKNDCFSAFLFRGCARFEAAMSLKQTEGNGYQGLLNQAIADFNLVLTFHKNSYEAYFWRARASQESDRRLRKEDRFVNEERAFLDYKNAIMLKTTFPEAYFHRASLKLDFIDLTGALQDAEKAKDLFLSQDKIVAYKEAVELENSIRIRINEFFINPSKKKETLSFLTPLF